MGPHEPTEHDRHQLRAPERQGRRHRRYDASAERLVRSVSVGEGDGATMQLGERQTARLRRRTAASRRTRASEGAARAAQPQRHRRTSRWRSSGHPVARQTPSGVEDRRHSCHRSHKGARLAVVARVAASAMRGRTRSPPEPGSAPRSRRSRERASAASRSSSRREATAASPSRSGRTGLLVLDQQPRGRELLEGELDDRRAGQRIVALIQQRRDLLQAAGSVAVPEDDGRPCDSGSAPGGARGRRRASRRRGRGPRARLCAPRVSWGLLTRDRGRAPGLRASRAAVAPSRPPLPSRLGAASRRRARGRAPRARPPAGAGPARCARASRAHPGRA